MLPVNIMELKFNREKNFEERLWFIHHYAQWAKSVPNRVWSREQARLIDSFMLNAQNFSLSPQEYLNLVDKGLKVKNKRRNIRKPF